MARGINNPTEWTIRGFPDGPAVKNPPAVKETQEMGFKGFDT